MTVKRKHKVRSKIQIWNQTLKHTDDTGAEVKVVADDLDELLVGLLAGAVRVDVDGERLGDTDGVGEELERGELLREREAEGGERGEADEEEDEWSER